MSKAEKITTLLEEIIYNRALFENIDNRIFNDLKGEDEEEITRRAGTSR